jgi:pimeloyl-ACP methyl ester carboxylesterase
LGLACASGGATPDPVIEDPVDDPTHPARLWQGQFTSGGARLSAIAYEAAGAGPHPTAILLHGFPGNERNLDLAQVLRRGGWNVVFFHYRGAWGSGGDFAFGHALDDVAAVTRTVGSAEWAGPHRVDPDRIALVGHSMGGMLAILAAAELPRAVDCVVAIAGADMAGRVPDDPDGAVAAQAAGRLDGMLAGRLEGTSGEALVGELAASRERFSLRPRAGALADRPLLLVAGARDRVVPPATAEGFAEAVTAEGGDPRVVILDADHAFSSARVALARNVLRFLEEKCR